MAQFGAESALPACLPACLLACLHCAGRIQFEKDLRFSGHDKARCRFRELLLVTLLDILATCAL